MDPWISPVIPYPVTPLDRGSGTVPSIAEPDGPMATRVLQDKIQHLIDYSYRKSSLVGRNAVSAQTMVNQTYTKSSLLSKGGPSMQTMAEQTYQKSSLVGRNTGPSPTGLGTKSVGRAVPYANILKYSYHSPPSRSVSPRQSLARKVAQTYHQQSKGNFSPTQQLISLSRTVSTHYRPAPATTTRISMIPTSGYFLVN